jgi:phospholipid/cholesterol/gamma-HCH transport system substrate-binding protein
VKSAIRKHLNDFIALVGLAAVGLGVAAYILAHQGVTLPFTGEDTYTLRVELSDAQAVAPGQGQTVRVAGVRVGDITRADLDEGRAIVTLELDGKYDKLVHSNATVLLRPRTGLKDMFVELDPGTKSAPLVPDGGMLRIASTAPDIDPDEILSVLDQDTRSYLKLLIAGGGKGLDGRGVDLRKTLARFEPLHRDLARVSAALARRRGNLTRLVHNYSELTNELGDRDGDLVRLVRASERVLDTFASEDVNLSSTIARLPSALGQTERTFAKLDGYSRLLTPTLDTLRPTVRSLARANGQVTPFARASEPVVREQIRPFVRTARPYVTDVRPAAELLSASAPDLTSAFHELNRFFNIAAYNPGGAEKLTGDLPTDLKRDEGYLYWLAWVGHNTNSLFAVSDAFSSFRRANFLASCSTLRRTLVAEEPALEPVLGLSDLFDDPDLCGKPVR